jgi:hypothetical protein
MTMLATQTPHTGTINALVQGAAQERQRAVADLNRKLAEEQKLHEARLTEKEAQRLAAEAAKAKARQQAVRLFYRQARAEACAEAPVLAERLLAELTANIKNGYPAALFNASGWHPTDRYYTGRVDWIAPPRCGYENLLEDAGVDIGKRMKLEAYRRRCFLETVGKIFHGSEVTLVRYRFEVGHGNAPKDFPPWRQEEVQLVFRPDDYLGEAEPLTGFWLNNDASKHLNCGHTISAVELRRY